MAVVLGDIFTPDPLVRQNKLRRSSRREPEARERDSGARKKDQEAGTREPKLMNKERRFVQGMHSKTAVLKS